MRPTTIKRFFLALTMSLATHAGSAATFSVTTISDTGATNCAGGGRCTFRSAIEAANATPTQDRIEFSVAGTFVPLTAFPSVTSRLVIDATTAPGYVDAPVVILDGLVAGASADGLRFSSGAAVSDVIGLAIVNFEGSGIETAGSADELLVMDCYIGIRPDGTPSANGEGIRLTTDSNLIGLPSNGNVITGNTDFGILISNSNNNEIVGNTIGARTGLTTSGNGSDGISIFGDGNRVGNLLGNGGNTISGNAGSGVFVIGNDNVVQGNFIGLSDGTVDGNGSDGIEIYGSRNVVGGSAIGEGNLVGGNTVGIRLGDVLAANDTVVEGNLVGIDYIANSGNASHGIVIGNGSNNLLTGNAVVGNEDGIRIDGNGNTLAGNRVGVAASSGMPTAGNRGIGVNVFGSNNVIGSDPALPVTPNRIGNNGSFGIAVGGDGNDLRGNHVGVNLAAEDLGNGASGIRAKAGVSNLMIRENVIGFNAQDGIDIRTQVNAIQVCGNYIGIFPTTNDDIGNSLDGIVHTGDGGVFGPIGDCGANRIGNNNGEGIDLVGSGNVIDGNRIGIDDAGNAAGNGLSGILLQTAGSTLNVIEDNIIAHNATQGIATSSGSGNGNRFFRNSMFANAVGIDIALDGRTINDVGDSDTGPNNRQNFPALGNVAVADSRLSLDFVVDSTTTDSAYPISIDLYLAGADGQGFEFLERINYPASSAQSQVSAVDIGLPPGVTGGHVVAIATDAAFNSSEFSEPLPFGLPDELFMNGFETP